MSEFATSENQIRNNRVFGVLLLLTETVLIFMFGFFIAYSAQRSISDDYYIIGALMLLALAGFGLITTYVKTVSAASLTHVIIILGLSIQLYFPFRGFWEIIGLSGQKYSLRNGDDVLPVSVTNYFNDRQSSQMLQSSPFTDYIACFISLIIGYSGLIGRVGNLEVYILTVIGTFLYEFVSMIFWRIFVTDCGYGMRIFLFGGCLGLFSSLLLGKKQTTLLHPKFMSEYYSQALNLFGAIIIWSLLPVLNWSDLWHSINVGNDSYILHIASLNMWFALCASAIGAVCGCIGVYKKLSVHTIIFSVFTGGIAYTSVADLDANTGAAIAIGMLTGALCSVATSLLKERFNQSGIKDSNGVLSSFLAPGFIAGLLSAIFQANGLNRDYPINYRGNLDSLRISYGQGAIQIAGLGIAAGNGIFGGVIAGLLMKTVSSRGMIDQFNQASVVVEQPPKPKDDGAVA